MTTASKVRLQGTIGLLLAWALLACTGNEFSSRGTEDAGSDENTEEVTGGPIDACRGVACPVLDCPPAARVSQPGECCPVCEVPRACVRGARCDALSCPGETTELSPGCCECADVVCAGESMRCTDRACVGAEQEQLGDGCCLCGDPLVCPGGQGACDSILCDGEVLYRGDGCCACEEASGCGAAAAECDSFSCDGTIVEVGGGCCECEAGPGPGPGPEPSPGPEPGVVCGSDAWACARIDCPGEVVNLGDGCCQCALACDPNLGEEDCATLECSNDLQLTPKGNGCCECAAGACGPGTALCSVLNCPPPGLTELGNDCCSCAQCAPGTHSCDNIECVGEVVPLANGCCECAVATVCGAELQLAYDRAKAELIREAGDSTCETAADCVLRAIDTRCRVECTVALPIKTADDIVTGLRDWATENCQECPLVPVECAIAGQAVCLDRTCRVSAAADSATPDSAIP